MIPWRLRKASSWGADCRSEQFFFGLEFGHESIKIVGMAVVSVTCMLFDVRAGSFFADDFSDNNLRDGMPVRSGGGRVCSMKAVDGDLILTGTPGNSFASSFVSGSHTDVSIRTQFRMEDASITRAGVHARTGGGDACSRIY